MFRIAFSILAASLLALASSGQDPATPSPDVPDPRVEAPPSGAELEAGDGWVSLFNGRDLTGWTPKIVGHALGEDPYGTVRVEEGIIRIGYDGYDEPFRGRFCHLFHEKSFSRYRLRIEYRFLGRQVAGGPGWAWRNSGAMLHCQDPSSMGLDQSFPVSIEGQLLGGDGTNDRSTANLCTPGTNVVIDGALDRRHCIESSSDTFHGDDWVVAEFVVDGGGTVKHFVNGRLVLEYAQPQLDPEDGDARALITDGNDLVLTSGWIALQGESHPVDFRKVEILELK